MQPLTFCEAVTLNIHSHPFFYVYMLFFYVYMLFFYVYMAGYTYMTPVLCMGNVVIWSTQLWVCVYVCVCVCAVYLCGVCMCVVFA